MRTAHRYAAFLLIGLIGCGGSVGPDDKASPAERAPGSSSAFGSTTTPKPSEPPARGPRSHDQNRADVRPAEPKRPRRRKLPRASGSAKVVAAGVTTDVRRAPRLEVRPKSRPPRRLLSRQVARGRGRRAAVGDEVGLSYTVTSWSTGRTVDSSRRHGMPMHFRIGDPNALREIDRVVRGMRLGERRVAIVPPRRPARGEYLPPYLTRGDALIFVLDLIRVRDANPGPGTDASSAMSPIRSQR